MTRSSRWVERSETHPPNCRSRDANPCPNTPFAPADPAPAPRRCRTARSFRPAARWRNRRLPARARSTAPRAGSSGPSRCSRPKVSYIDSTTAGARPSDGSSSISSFGSLINARPTASICRSPPDMVPARWLRRSFKFRKDFVDAFEQRRCARLVVQRRGAEHQIVLDALLHEQPPALRRQRQSLAHDGKGALPADLLAAETDRAANARE